MSIDFRIIALIGALGLAACGGGQEEADQGTNTSDTTEEATVPVFDATGYALGWRGAPLDGSNLVSIEEDGLLLTGQNAQPQVGLAEAFPVEPGIAYRVSAKFEFIGSGESAKPNLTAWSLSEDGTATSDRNYSVAFMSDRGNITGVQEIEAIYTLTPYDAPEDAPLVYTFADTEEVAMVRFTTNPVRDANGVQARLVELSVTPVDIDTASTYE